MFEVAEFSVKFWHDRYPDPIKYRFSSNLVQAKTVCVIRDTPNGKPSDPLGIAYCSVEDQFSYNEGRKRALERALETARFNKSTRTLFWKAYFKKRGKVG